MVVVTVVEPLSLTKLETMLLLLSNPAMTACGLVYRSCLAASSGFAADELSCRTAMRFRKSCRPLFGGIGFTLWRAEVESRR